MTNRQISLLLAVVKATADLGRAPYSSEVMPLLAGSDRRSTRQRLCRLRDLGMVVFASVPRALHPAPVRLTPAAKIALGLPIVVYGAWPIPSDDNGVAMAESSRIGAMLADAMTAAVEAVVISPFLNPTPWKAGVVAGAQIARACDAVVVLRDRTLLGRGDVHAARVARLRCAVVESVGQLSQLTPATLWAPPYLEPDLPDVHTAVR